MGPFELVGWAKRRSAGNAVLREESERPIQPRLAPPLPAKTVTLTGPHQMVPNLLFDPVANVREASARMPDGKVLHPASQHRVDFRNHVADGPGPMAAENLLERAQQRRPLFPLRGVKRHPSVSPTANPTEVKAEKSEALALRQVHPPSLLLVHLDVERRQFLTESPFDRRAQPVLSRVGIYEDHEVIGESSVFDARPPLIAGDLLRSLQHAVDLIEVHVAEQGRNHSPNAKGNFQFERVIVGWRGWAVLDLRRK